MANKADLAKRKRSKKSGPRLGKRTHPSDRAEALLSFALSQLEARLHLEKLQLSAALDSEVEPMEETASPWREQDSTSAGVIREVDLSDWGAVRQRLRQVDEALERLNEGTYGDCTECGRKIEAGQLVFDPAVSLCLTCRTGIMGRPS